MVRYVCESDIPQSDIQAGAAAGVLLPWRVDAAGRQWFVELPATIQGTPGHQAQADILEGTEADDDEPDDLEDIDAGDVAPPVRGVDTAGAPVGWDFT